MPSVMWRAIYARPYRAALRAMRIVPVVPRPLVVPVPPLEPTPARLVVAAPRVHPPNAASASRPRHLHNQPLVGLHLPLTNAAVIALLPPRDRQVPRRRVRIAHSVVPGRYCSPRHTVPFSSRTEGSKCKCIE